MIIVIASAKGGSGKTTTAIHLAEWLSRKRNIGSVTLQDADPDNQSATAWYEQGEDWKFDLISHDEESINDVLVVDSGAAPDSDDLAELVEVSDLLIVPTAPSFLDIQSAARTVAQFEQDGSATLLVTLAPSGRSKAGQNAIEALKEAELTVCSKVIRRRAVLGDAAGLGTTVASIKGDAAAKAWAEHQAAFKSMLGGLL